MTFQTPDVIKNLQRTLLCSNSSWRESQKILKGAKGSCLDKWLCEEQKEIAHEGIPSHVFLSLLDSVSSLMLISSHQNHLVVSCSPLLLLYSSAQHQEWISWGEQECYRSFLLHLLQNLPMTSWRSLKKDSTCFLILTGYRFEWKVQMIHSQTPPSLFNSVLCVHSGNLKNSIWLGWAVMQLWWASRSRCIWNLLAWNIHIIFLGII